MSEKCMECEMDTIQKYSELYIEYKRVKNYNKILEKCLDTKDELCKALRDRNEELENRLRIYKND